MSSTGRTFLSIAFHWMVVTPIECGLVQVLKLLHHPDEYVSREAFLLADALIQQVP